jgi:hypothetical protein
MELSQLEVFVTATDRRVMRRGAECTAKNRDPARRSEEREGFLALRRLERPVTPEEPWN